MERKKLIDVYSDTIKCLQEECYTEPGGEIVDLQQPDSPVFYDKIEKLSGIPGGHQTEIKVLGMDTFDATRLMGSDCAVLNMASYRQPGGGVENGAMAQEEELCRRSTLLRSLYLSIPLGYYYFQEKMATRKDGKEIYPLGTYQGIYTKNVTVFKDSSGEYRKLASPFMCNVITLPALANPELNKDKTYKDKSRFIMIAKIRQILRIALSTGNTKIILGAFGCGAYHNPPMEVAKLFKQVFAEKEFRGKFEKIWFAIIDDNNSNGNYSIFKNEFEGE